MHALNGNTVLRLHHSSSCLRGHVELQLEELIPHTSCRYSPQEILQHRFASFSLDERHTQSFRSLPIVQTTPQFHLSTPRDKDNLKGSQEGDVGIKTPKEFIAIISPVTVVDPQFVLIHRIQLEKPRTPPPRGMPGAPLGRTKSVPHRQEGGNNALKRGAKRRRLRRQSYRRWCAQRKQHRLLGETYSSQMKAMASTWVSSSSKGNGEK